MYKAYENKNINRSIKTNARSRDLPKNYFLKLILNSCLSFFIGTSFLFTYSNFFLIPFLIIMTNKKSKEFVNVTIFTFLGLLFYFAKKTYMFTFTSVVINQSLLIKYFTAIMLIILFKHFTLKVNAKINNTIKAIVASIITLFSGIILLAYYSFSIYHISLLFIEIILSFILSLVLIDGINFTTLNNIYRKRSLSDFELLSIILVLFIVLLGASNVTIFGIAMSKPLLITFLALISYYIKSSLVFFLTFFITFLYSILVGTINLELVCILSVICTLVSFYPKKNKLIICVSFLILFGILSKINVQFQSSITTIDFLGLAFGLILFSFIDLVKFENITNQYAYLGNIENFNRHSLLKLQEQLNITYYKLINTYENAALSINKSLHLNDESLEYSPSEFLKQKEIINSLKILMQDQYDLSIETFNNFAVSIKKDVAKYITDENKLYYLLEKNSFNVLNVIFKDTKNNKLEIELYIKDFIDSPTKKTKILKLIELNTNKKFYISKSILSMDNKTYLLTLNEVPPISLNIAHTLVAKNNNNISGDSYTIVNNFDGNSIVGISDGMGSGNDANKKSSTTLNILDDLFVSNISISKSIKLINTIGLVNGDESFSSLDLANIDRHNGTCNFYKLGSCPSYILRNGKVKKIQTNSLPLGIVKDISVDKIELKIQDNDIIFMITDGIFESNKSNIDKDLWLINMLQRGGHKRLKDLCSDIINKSISMGNSDLPEDDMLIMAIKIKYTK